MAGPRIIVVDGPDYAGKSTLIKSIRATAEAAGHTVTMMAFPRHSNPDGAKARALIAGMSSDKQLIAEHLTNDFIAAVNEISSLTDEHVVLFDRYCISTYVYQGHAAYLKHHQIGFFNSPIPVDRYIVAWVPYSVAIQRHRKRQAEQGEDWDSEFTLRGVMRDEQSWNETVGRFEYYTDKLDRWLAFTRFDVVENLNSEDTVRNLALFD